PLAASIMEPEPSMTRTRIETARPPSALEGIYPGLSEPDPDRRRPGQISVLLLRPHVIIMLAGRQPIFLEAQLERAAFRLLRINVLVVPHDHHLLQRPGADDLRRKLGERARFENVALDVVLAACRHAVIHHDI